MANKFVRSSKYRHVFANVPKKDSVWDGVSMTKNAWDSNWVAASGKYVCVCWQTSGGGAVGVLDANKPGKLEPTKVPLISGHSGAVLDLQFDPFNDSVLATVSEDATCKLWKIPDEGLADGAHFTEDLQTLKGHKRKCGTLAFHPTVENCIATGAQDYDIRIWDIETGETKLTVPGHTNIIQSIGWNYDGSRLVTQSKDKQVRILDPRQQEICAAAQSHVGVKGGRALYLGKHDKILTVGFGTGASREYMIWDPKSFDKPIVKANLDNSSGGDGSIRYYEIAPDSDAKSMVFPVSTYRTNDSSSGCGAVYRRHCNVSANEIIRLYQVTGTQVRPLSFQVPRKSDLFQDDLYPDCRGDTPALSYADWLSGKDATPILVNLEQGFTPAVKTEKKVIKVEEEKELTPLQMKQQFEELTKKVAYLEAEVAKRDAKIKELEGQ